MKERFKCLTTVYKENLINAETGELKQIKEHKRYWMAKEPYYIKMYGCVQADFPKIKKLPLGLLFFISNNISGFNDDEHELIVYESTKDTRKQLAEYLEISERMATNYITNLVEGGVLFHAGIRGKYFVNPHFIARGTWDKIKEIQAKFIFKDNKWSFIQA